MKRKTYIHGAKWGGLKEFIFDVANNCDLDLHILDEDKGLFTTTIYFQLEGSKENLIRFNKIGKESIEKNRI